jgi:hypothetical protein
MTSAVRRLNEATESGFLLIAPAMYKTPQLINLYVIR